MHRHLRSVALSASFALLCVTAVAAQVPQVERFAPHEVALSAQGTFANPYIDLTADAVLTEPTGGKTRTVPLFWGGGASWKFRFAPNQLGTWKWTVDSRDPGLMGKSGSFEVVASQRHGSIRPTQGFPQHFERQDGSPFWFLGDTAWALYTDSAEERHDREAALKYIDARAGQGFNILHSMLLSEAGWGNRGGPPFDDIAAQRLNPGYWQEVDLRLAHANSKGIVCGLALAWGDKGRGERYAWSRFPDAEARRRYARYVAARYSAFDVYFLVSGEWHAEVRARKSNEAEIRQEFIAIGDVLHAADPHHRMVAIHPMTAHGSVREFVGAGWMAFGDYQQNYRDLHGRILESRAVGNALRGVPGPVVDSEYGYFLRDQSGDGVPDKDNSTSLEAMRHATWDIAMAGGYVVTGFGTTYFGGNRDPGPFDLAAAKNRPWEEQIGRVKEIFAKTQWWKLAPHDELLTCDTPRGKEGQQFGRVVPPAATYWCLAEPGRQYLLYLRGLSKPLELKLDAKGPTLSATRFNPRSGEQLSLGPVAGDRPYEFSPPDEQDWIILLTNQARP
jgi:hypothetical protein